MLALTGGCLVGSSMRVCRALDARLQGTGRLEPAMRSRGNWVEHLRPPAAERAADQVDLSNRERAVAKRACAMVEQSRSGLWPTVALLRFATRSRAVSGSIINTSNVVNVYNMPLTASWAPDSAGAACGARSKAILRTRRRAPPTSPMRGRRAIALAINYFNLRVLDAL